MIVALILLSSIVLVGAVLYIHHRLTGGDRLTVDPPQIVPDENGEVCCGQHAVCERNSLLMAAAGGKIEYFDDEHLDRFAGRNSTDYSDEEIEEFRDVLLTLMPEDVAPWGRSMQMRSITLPEAVREELIMLVSEARAQRI